VTQGVPLDPEPAHQRLDRSALKLAVWTIILLTIATGPFLIFQYPGLQDYPNHLARGFILLHPSDPVLRNIYEVQWTPLPNLGWDIWAVIVGRVLSLEWTGKLYLIVSGLSMILGCFALQRALLSRWTFAPLLATPFLFNAGFTMGFLNFELAVGCSLLAAAWWVSVSERLWIRRLSVATLLASGLYFIHFYGWAFYGVFVFGFELQSTWQRVSKVADIWPRLLHLLRDATQAVPALALMIYVARTSPQPALTLVDFKPPYIRIGQLERLVDIGHPMWNAAIQVLFSLLMIVVFYRGWLKFRNDLIWPIALCIGIFFLLPDRISSTFYVSWRILLMTLLLAIASCVPTNEGRSRMTPILTVVALITFVIVCVQVWSWRTSELGRKAFIEITEHVPVGSALFVVHNGMTSQRLRKQAVGLYHVGSYAVITRRALVQSMFVLPEQQILRFRNPLIQDALNGSSTHLSELKRAFRTIDSGLSDHLQQFDYVVVHGPDSGDDLEVLSSDSLSLVDRVQDFRLYKVIKTH
jgi:hypothetical protein